jgi:hypothetical protein
MEPCTLMWQCHQLKKKKKKKKKERKRRKEEEEEEAFFVLLLKCRGSRGIKVSNQKDSIIPWKYTRA